jgi:uncharacterized protein YecE (DUF72 family)
MRGVASIRIGISGWRYPPWRGVFYPQGLAQARELEFAAQHFPSVEINGSFYSLQRPEFYARWYEQTPRGFVFAVKGGRFITHMKKLRDVEQAVANFFASGVLALRDKLGPILWQFPESMPHALDRFEAFLQLLPRDTDAAARLARGHGPQLRGRALTESDGARKIRHAFELRNEASATPELIALLRAYGVAWVIADTAGRWPYFEDVTADFVYVRLHGDEQLYASGYSDRALARWAGRIACWRDGGEPPDAQRIAGLARPRASGRDVYVYFDNDIKVYAPFDALTLQRALGLRAWQEEAVHADRRRPGRRVREEPLRSASAWPGVAAMRRGSAAGAPARARGRSRTGS